MKYKEEEEDIMAVVSLRLNQEEESFFKNYADFTGKSLSSLFKEALAQEIEDELDYKLGVEGVRAFEADVGQGYSIAEARKELGLENV